MRTLLIGVAIAALAFTAVVIPFHRHQMANYHRARGAILSEQATHGELMCMTPLYPEPGYVAAVAEVYGPEAGRAQQQAFEHIRLARAYRRIAYCFWLPDPIEPPGLK
jgi:hypothetical protein